MAWTALGAFEQAQLAFDGASWWDDLSEARLREARAVLNLRRGLLDAAEQDLRRAGALFGRHGNRRGEARTLANMSDLQSQHGQFAAAEESARRGAEAARASGDNVVLTYCLANQGVALQGLGQDASQALTRAHALATRLGNLPLARSLHELMHPAGDPDYSAR
jgi:tetratricopeptide (TPR) repeat protein